MLIRTTKTWMSKWGKKKGSEGRWQRGAISLQSANPVKKCSSSTTKSKRDSKPRRANRGGNESFRDKLS
jgi:hypothetical protein